MRYQNNEEHEKQSTRKVVTVDLGLGDLVPNVGISSDGLFMKYHWAKFRFFTENGGRLGRQHFRAWPRVLPIL